MVRALIDQEQDTEGQASSRPGLECWPCIPCIRLGYPWIQFPHLQTGDADSCEDHMWDAWKASVLVPVMPFLPLNTIRCSLDGEQQIPWTPASPKSLSSPNVP